MANKNSKEWKPDINTLQELISTLQISISAHDKNTNQSALQKLAKAQEHPEYICYLSYIFSHSKKAPLVIRQISGLTLKNYIKRYNPTKMDSVLFDYFKTHILKAICDEEVQVSNTAALVVESVLKQSHVCLWKDFIPSLRSLYASNDPCRARGALKTLSIAAGTLLAQNENFVYEEELSSFLPLTVRILSDANENNTSNLRNENSPDVLCLQILVSFSAFGSDFFVRHTPSIFAVLFKLRCDEQGRLKTLLANFFANLLYYRADAFLGYYPRMSHICMQALSETQRGLKIAANDYFYSYCSNLGKNSHDALLPMIPQLVSALFNGVFYTQEMLALLENNETENETKMEFNMRKLLSATMEALAESFKETFFNPFFALIDSEISLIQKKENWIRHEASVLCLGVLANHTAVQCRAEKIAQFLLEILQSSRNDALLSTAMWSLARFAVFCVDSGSALVEPTLRQVSKFVVSPSVVLQQSSCSTLTAFAEIYDSFAKIKKFIPDLIRGLLLCFDDYKNKNSLLFCKNAAVALMRQSAGHVPDAEFGALFCQPFLERLMSHKLGEKSALLLDALSSAAPLLKPKFAALASTVIKAHFPVFPEYLTRLSSDSVCLDFVVSLLEFSVSTCNALEDSLGDFFARKFLEMAFLSLKSGDSVVRQTAFILLGTVTKFCPIHLKESLAAFVQLCVENLDSSDVILFNNANWSIGEICQKEKQAVSKHIDKIFPKQVAVLNGSCDFNNSGLVSNVVVTIGLLCYYFPQKSALYAHLFSKNWLTHLMDFPTTREKILSAQGLMQVIAENPNVFLSCFHDLCLFIVRFQEPGADLQNAFVKILTLYKTNLKNEWEGYLQRCGGDVVAEIHRRYNV